MIERLDDDASPSGQRSAIRDTASTAPGINGSSRRYSSATSRATSSEISSGGSGTPSSSLM